MMTVAKAEYVAGLDGDSEPISNKGPDSFKTRLHAQTISENDKAGDNLFVFQRQFSIPSLVRIAKELGLGAHISGAPTKCCGMTS
jgi:hypothetical protein